MPLEPEAHQSSNTANETPSDAAGESPLETPSTSYRGFLRVAIKKHWSGHDRSRLEQLALLLAGREAWGVAWDETSGRSLIKGAAGAAAVTVLLRTIMGGPLGLLLTGASAASLVALYVRHHDRIWAQVDHYRAVIDAFAPQHAEILTDYAAGQLRESQRDLMIDGLMARFVERLGEVPEVPLEED